MKLIVSIVSSDDANDVCSNLTKHKYYVTKLATNGGFLKAGNCTLLVGVEDEKVDEVISLIKEKSSRRTEIITPTNFFDGNQLGAFPIEVQAGGATIFVLNVEQFMKV